MTAAVDMLQVGTDRLAHLVEPLTPGELRQPAYPSEWSIADVLSHLGSGAVITQLCFECALADQPVDDDIVQSIWAEWDAKSPDDQAVDVLQADQLLIYRLDSLTDDERREFRSTMGPLDVDYTNFTRLRLNEQALHTWDIAVVIDPGATIPSDTAEVVIDTLGTVVAVAGTPRRPERVIRIRTVDPSRDLKIQIGSDRVTLEPTPSESDAAIALPAEALVRLVYGRLDLHYTPPITGSHTDLDLLRRVFPGF